MARTPKSPAATAQESSTDMATELETIAEPTTGTMSALDRIVHEGRMAQDESQEPYARGLVAEFVNQVVEQGDTMPGNVADAINQRIAQIDQLITDELNAVMHAPEFKTLEATWRGLSYLVQNTETGPV